MGRFRGFDWIAAGALLVSGGAVVAAVNWYSTWSFFALTDVQLGSGGGALTLEALQTFQLWVVVAVGALLSSVALAMAPRMWAAYRSPGAADPEVPAVADA